MVTFKRIFSPNIWESTRFCWTLGSQERRVLCFEKGTLFPDSFVLPWKRPSWERLKGLETTSQRALLGNMANAETTAVCQNCAKEQSFVSVCIKGLCHLFWAGRPNSESLFSSGFCTLKTPLNFYSAAMEGLLLLERGPDIKAYLSMRCSCTQQQTF